MDKVNFSILRLTLTFFALFIQLITLACDVSGVNWTTVSYYHHVEILLIRDSLLSKINSFTHIPSVINFGLWGFCYGENPSSPFICSEAKLGYEIRKHCCRLTSTHPAFFR